MQFGRPRTDIRFWIVNRELNIHVSKVAPGHTLRQVKRIRDRDTLKRHPALPIETPGLDHQRVPLPTSDRIAHPRGIRVLRKLPAIREDLAERCPVLIKNQNQSGNLNIL